MIDICPLSVDDFVVSFLRAVLLLLETNVPIEKKTIIENVLIFLKNDKLSQKVKTKFEASRVKVNINNTRVNDGPHGKLNFYIEKVCRVARLSFQDDI